MIPPRNFFSTKSSVRVLLFFVLISSLILPQDVQAQVISFPAEINKEFSPISIASGGISRLTVTIFNPNLFEITDAAWADNLIGVQPGLTIANPVNLTNTCGGIAVALAGGTSFSLSGGTVLPQVGAVPGSCSVSINVTSTIAGNLINTIPTGGLTGTGGGGTISNTTPASATITVIGVDSPSINKGFAPNTIFVGEVSQLTITLNNNDPNTSLTGTSYSDTLPAGLVLATPVNATVTGCGVGYSLVAVAGTDTISLSNATVAPSPNCIVRVDVTGSSGTYTNTIPAGPNGPGSVHTDQGVTNNSPASANLNIQPVNVEKSVSPTSIQAGGTTTLTITLENPTGSNYTGVGISDTLPGVFIIANPANVTNTCGGSVTAVPGTQLISLSGGTIPASVSPPTPVGSCVITVQVTAPVGSSSSTSTNIIPAGTLIADQPGITNIADATANISVYPVGGGLEASKSFSPNTIDVGGNSRLRINLRAPQDTDLTNFSMVDNLPPGVTISNSSGPNVNNGCGAGYVLTAVTGATSISLTNGTILAGQLCRIDVWVTSSTPGLVTNTISPANISNDQNRGPVNNINANLNVRQPSDLTVSKAFYPNQVVPNGISTLTITLENTNTNNLINVSATDNLGTMGGGGNTVRIASPPNASTTCGGTLTAVAGTQIISLSGGTIPAQSGGIPGSCTISVDVQAQSNTSNRTNTIPLGNVSGEIQNVGTTINALANATAQLRTLNLSIGVVKGFNPVLVYGGAASTLSVQLINPNNATLLGIAFTDDMTLLGTGIIIANPANLNTGTCGGALTGNPGDTSFSFSGGTLPPNTSCTLTVSTTMQVNGNLTNLIPAGAVTTLNGVSSPEPTQASLTNLPGASVSKSFSPNPINTGQYSLLTIIIRNTGNIPLTGMGLTDTLPGALPAGLMIAGAPAPSPVNNCGGTLTAVTGEQLIQLVDGSLGGTSSCTIVVAVTSNVPGSYQNIIPAGSLASNEGATNNTPATDTLVVLGQTSASLGDFVWNDLNADGIQDVGEPGIDGVTVNLYSSNGTLIRTTTTANGGLYLFDDLTPGDYYVEFIPPAGYVISPQDQGGNDGADSDANPSSGQTIPTTLVSGENDLTWDAGLYQLLNPNDLSKTILDTSLSTTTGANTAIGEIVTYQVSVTIRQGSYSNARVVDTMDRGLAFVGCDSIQAPGLSTDVAGSFAGACANPTTDDAGGGTPMDVDRRVTFDLGTLTNNSQGDATLTITYRAIVLDTATNVNGVSLNNTALFGWSGGSIGPAQTRVTIVEPEIFIDKTANTTTIRNGTEVTFTLTISHSPTSTSDAFDVVVTDILPTGLTYVTNSLDCTSGAQDPDVECVFDNSNPLQPTIRAEWSVFALNGGVGRIRFRVAGNASIPSNGNVTNTSNVEWTSMPGDQTTPNSFSNPANQFATERYYDPGDLINLYGSTDSVTLTSPGNPSPPKPAPTPVVTTPLTGGFLIPVTGFAPNVVTDLSVSGAPRAAYSDTSIMLDIPALSVDIPIVGVPKKDGGWNVSWLTNQAGWLEGSAFPSWNGNSVLTSHVYLSNGKPGPFAKLHELKTGDQVVVHAFGQKYIFEVQTNATIAPTDRSVMKHEERPWLTLVTCTDYDQKTGTYKNRFIVRAVLVKVSLDK